MNQHFTILKKAIEVFHSYGITLIGQHKNADFIQQLQMDPVFINGLIFELEYQLHVIFQDEKLGTLHTPMDLIALLVNIPQEN